MSHSSKQHEVAHNVGYTKRRKTLSDMELALKENAQGCARGTMMKLGLLLLLLLGPAFFVLGILGTLGFLWERDPGSDERALSRFGGTAMTLLGCSLFILGGILLCVSCLKDRADIDYPLTELDSELNVVRVEENKN